jgi:Protein of unknown function (DUF4058)
MPVHNWTRVEAGIFHDFHHDWITEIKRALNRGLLPPYYYALAEQIAGGFGPDVLPLKHPVHGSSVVIRHTSRHHVVALIEIVSPGNKNNRHGIRSFVQKAHEALRAGIHLVIADVLPPGPRDPQGFHPLIWEEIGDDDFTLTEDKPLTLASYIGGPIPEAFINTTAVGSPLPEMPLFLTPDVYVPLPLDATYQAAFDGVPGFWRDVLR